MVVAAVFAAGVALVAAAGLTWDHEDVAFLACMGVLTVASEFLDFGPFKNSRVSISIVLIFAAGVFSGLPGAIVLAGVAVVADAVAHRKPLRKVLFNFGSVAATAGVFVGVLSALSSSYDSKDWVAKLAPASAAAAVAYVVNSGLVTLVISIDKKSDFFAVWSSHFRWLLPHFVFFGLFGVFMAVAWDRWGLGGFALFVLPLAMVWLAVKQYADSAARLQAPPAPEPKKRARAPRRAT